MASARKTGNGRVIAKYTIPQYFKMLKLGGLSAATERSYTKVFQMYAKFLGVSLDEVHKYISVSDLLNFAYSRNGKSPAGTKTALSVLRRYATLNGLVFDELEFKAMNPKVNKEHNDKPLTLPMLQGMMDLTDAHGRSLLTFLVSTGLRAGELTQIELSDIGRIEGKEFVTDITGDVIKVRNEIAKNGHGGLVFLTAEAREYLSLWLKERDEYLAIADARMKGLVKAGAHHRKENDNRVFGVAYTSFHKWFTRLYDKVDGEKGKYHNACTPHACRKYFRTVAAQAMHPDLVTNLMRQTGYLDNTYVRMPDADKRRQFKEKEAVLYLTRADHRVQSGKLAEQAREIEALKADMEAMTAFNAAKNDPDTLIEYANWLKAKRAAQ